MPSKSDQDSLTSILAFQFIVVTALVVGVAVWILDSSIGRDLEANRVALEENHAALLDAHAALVELHADVAKSFDRLEQVIRSEFERSRAAINADRRAADTEMREIRNLVSKLGTVRPVQEE